MVKWHHQSLTAVTEVMTQMSVSASKSVYPRPRKFALIIPPEASLSYFLKSLFGVMEEKEGEVV